MQWHIVCVDTLAVFGPYQWRLTGYRAWTYSWNQLLTRPESVYAEHDSDWAESQTTLFAFWFLWLCWSHKIASSSASSGLLYNPNASLYVMIFKKFPVFPSYISLQKTAAIPRPDHCTNRIFFSIFFSGSVDTLHITVTAYICWQRQHWTCSKCQRSCRSRILSLHSRCCNSTN